MKLYIAVLDTVPDFMVPTLVAHSVLGAHLEFSEHHEFETSYNLWLNQAFKKVVLRVNQKEFDKILMVYILVMRTQLSVV
jgi:peptidyl-tRNA hydrolase